MSAPASRQIPFPLGGSISPVIPAFPVIPVFPVIPIFPSIPAFPSIPVSPSFRLSRHSVFPVIPAFPVIPTFPSFRFFRHSAFPVIPAQAGIQTPLRAFAPLRQPPSRPLASKIPHPQIPKPHPSPSSLPSSPDPGRQKLNCSHHTGRPHLAALVRRRLRRYAFRYKVSLTDKVSLTGRRCRIRPAVGKR